MPINNDRRVAITQARQGGFSAYLAAEGVVTTTSALQTGTKFGSRAYVQGKPLYWQFTPQQDGGQWLFDTPPLAPVEATLAEGPPSGLPVWSLRTIGGPYTGAHSIRNTRSIASSAAIGGGSFYVDSPDAAPADGKFTLEAYLRINITSRSTGTCSSVVRLSIGNTLDSVNIALELNAGGGTSSGFYYADYNAISFVDTEEIFTHDIGSGSVDSWKHYAIVHTPGEIRQYLDGSLVGTHEVGTSTGVDWSQFQRVRLFSDQAQWSTSGTFSYTADGHMMRYTPEEKYTANFTPPTA